MSLMAASFNRALAVASALCYGPRPMEVLREIGVIFLTELRRQVRSAKGAALLILYALGAGIAGMIFVWVTRSANLQLKASLNGQELDPEAISQFKTGFLAWVYGKDDALIEYLVTVPSVVLFLFWTTLKFLPWLVLLVGFDQISGELGLRSLRFVVLRARRTSVVLGKFLAQMALIGILTFIVEAGLFGFAAAVVPDFDVAVGLPATVRFWLVSLAFASAYMGIASFCSSLFRTSWFSLLAAVCGYFGLWLIYFLAKIFDRLSFLGFLSPTHYEPMLVRPSLGELAPAVGAYLAFALVFVAGTWAVMRWRDL
jgi:hypothetical protein